MGQLRGGQFRQMTPYSQGRRLQTEKSEAQAEEAFDEAKLTDSCVKKNHTSDVCPVTASSGSSGGCCWCDIEKGGCTCEAHYHKWGRSKFWTKCEEIENGRKCQCVQELTSAKAAVKAAAGAIAGASTGTKIGYQVFGALFYWCMFVKRGPKERGPRVQYPTNAFVPFDMLGPLNDGEWKVGPFECCGDCTGSIVSFVLFTPRMATTWWAMSLVTTKDPKHAWIWSLLQVIICFPIFPLIGLTRRGRIRDMFKMPAEFGSDCFCWCCCFPLMICQEARLIDMAHGYRSGLCGQKVYFPPAMGPCNLIINDGARQDARGASWNNSFIGQDFKGKLLVDASNLFGKSDFSIDCSGSVILMSRGDVSFQQKIVRAASAGAKAAIIFSNEDKEAKPLLMIPTDPGVPAPKIPAAYVSKEVGTKLIDMLDKGLVNVELQFGLELVNDLAQVEMQRAVDPKDGKVVRESFGGYLKEGLQFVPGGTMKGNNLEELIEDLKNHKEFPATCIIAPAGSKTDVPKQEEMK
jgi:Cys-rich protein (TIGR01571 family)